MKRSWTATLAILFLSAAAMATSGQEPGTEPTPGEPTPAEPHVFPAPIPPDTNWVFVLKAGNRLYPDWKESHEVKFLEEFPIGDTPFYARVTKFIPDFCIVDGKTTSWSLRLDNPAVRVFVYADSGAVDSTWAFLKMPPHYSARSFFSFELEAVRGYVAPAESGSGMEEKER